MFDLNGKIALVTGGASGIGLCYIKELLRSGVKGITMVDVDSDSAQTAIADIENEFGSKKVQFVKADVSDIQQLEHAFKETVDTYGNIDIVINNAGIFNDGIWQKEIAINLAGVVNGILLGLENYLPKHKQGPEAVIINTASLAGIDFSAGCPIYSATKAAVIALTRCWGDPYHYERTKVRLFVICPGVTITPIISGTNGKFLGKAYEDWILNKVDEVSSQQPEHVAQEVTKLIQDCPNGSIWVVEGGQPACQYILPKRQEAYKNTN